MSSFTQNQDISIHFINTHQYKNSWKSIQWFCSMHDKQSEQHMIHRAATCLRILNNRFTNWHVKKYSTWWYCKKGEHASQNGSYSHLLFGWSWIQLLDRTHAISNIPWYASVPSSKYCNSTYNKHDCFDPYPSEFKIYNNPVITKLIKS